MLVQKEGPWSLQYEVSPWSMQCEEKPLEWERWASQSAGPLLPKAPDRAATTGHLPSTRQLPAARVAKGEAAE